MLFTILLIKLILYSSHQSSKFNEFSAYVSRNIKPDSTLINDCKWRYALVKVSCDKSNRITNYDFLNDVPASVKKCFTFLKGYHFNKNINTRNRPIIFITSFENHNTDCILSNKELAADAAKNTYSIISKQLKAQPNTIMVEETITVTYNHDPVK